jgi:hypothetical protein
VTVTSQTGGWWLVEFAGTTQSGGAYPFLAINRTAGDEQSYTGSDVTKGLKFGLVEMLV